MFSLAAGTCAAFYMDADNPDSFLLHIALDRPLERHLVVIVDAVTVLYRRYPEQGSEVVLCASSHSFDNAIVYRLTRLIHHMYTNVNFCLINLEVLDSIPY